MSRYQIRYSNTSSGDFGNLLGDISAPDYEYYDATLDEQINCAGTLKFTLLPTNPALPDLALKKTTITLYRNDTKLWQGRIIRTEIDMFNRRVIICEGALAWLYDIMRAGYSAPSGASPSTVITALLADYLGKCPTTRRITWGTVEPTTVWYGTEKNDYVPIFDILAQLLANSGGYFRIRYASQTYLDYLNYPTTASGQVITFGQNLFDVARVLDASNVATHVIAEDSGGHVTTVSDTDLANAFGRTEVYHYFDHDYGSAISLGVAAKIWLLQNCLSETTISVTALDLNLTDEAYDAFYIGQPVRIISPPHGIDTTMILTGLQTNLSNPAASRITLGTVPKSLTSYMASGGKTGSSSNDHIVSISPTISQSGGNSTLTLTDARKCGQIVELGFHIVITGNVAEGENIWSGTLSNYLPVAYISTASYYGVATPSCGVFRITGAGDINFRLVKGALTSGAEMYCGITYITEG